MHKVVESELNILEKLISTYSNHPSEAKSREIAIFSSGLATLCEVIIHDFDISDNYKQVFSELQKDAKLISKKPETMNEMNVNSYKTKLSKYFKNKC